MFDTPPFSPNKPEQVVFMGQAPGRVNLIGEHTDYNEGFTLPLAIDRYTTVRIQLLPSESATSRYLSQSLDQWAEWTPDGSQFIAAPNSINPGSSEAPSWSKYVAGVIQQFAKFGHAIPPFELTIESNVPLGGGVSSSAALEVSVAMAMQRLLGTSLEALAIAHLCQRAEHEYAGVPCGLMDQLSSVFGQTDQLMLMDCRTNQLEYIPARSEVAFIVINSRVKHNLGDGEYRMRRMQCEQACRLLGVTSLRDVSSTDLVNSQANLSDIIYRRARHVVSENLRTVQAAEYLKSGQWQLAGELMNASHVSMRDDYEITCPEIDTLVSIAQELGLAGGVYGARMTGGGFGGCIIILGQTVRASEILEYVCSAYEQTTGIQADSFVTRPAAGAWQFVSQSPR